VSLNSNPDESPSGIYTIYRNYWWIHHPEEEKIAFRRIMASKLNGFLYPQGNQREDVISMIRDRMYPWARVLRVPIVIQPGVHGAI
jgi:hypothetical protein